MSLVREPSTYPVDASLIESKLRAPAVRQDLVDRVGLDASLDRAARRRLTIVSAPTGYGKTTLMSGWVSRGTTTTAWLTLDAAENDPARLLRYLVGAFERAGVVIDDPIKRSVAAPRADLAGTVLPMLLNELAARPEQVFLVVDDYQVLTDSRCHEMFESLVRDAPDHLHTILATRSDPPLPLGRWRAAGVLSELRQSELRFDLDEATLLLNDVLGLELDQASVATLEERTEGWPAGLCLAAMSLSSRVDRAAFIRDFAGSSRHLVDYLGPEVLAPLGADDRQFLLETSILERLTGPLCDEVTGRRGSDARLRALYRGNLFLTALDDDDTWYRHHRLFAELLRSILASESPDLVPVLHGRAADWHSERGPLESAVRHAMLAGRREQACLALARDWRRLTSAGLYETLQAMLDALGPDRGALTAPLASVEAINAGLRGASHDVVERCLAIAERAPWEGPTPDGLEDISIPIAVARATFIGRDLSTATESGRWLVGRQPDAPYVDGVGRSTLAMSLVLAGDPNQALVVLDGFGEYPDTPLVDLHGLAARALALTMSGDPQRGEAVAELASVRARNWGLAHSLIGGAVALAHGVAIARQGRLEEAEPHLEMALKYWGIPADTLPRAHTLLCLAPVVAANGDLERARRLTLEARSILAGCPNAGSLPQLLGQVERGLNIRLKRTIRGGEMPTEAEIRVLRLLAGPLTQGAIANELYLSHDTVKTHVKAIYRRLGVASRNEAVERSRDLGII